MDKIYFTYKINMNTTSVYAKKFHDLSLYDNEKTVYEYIKYQQDPELNQIVPLYCGYNDCEKQIFIENISEYINIHETIQKISSQQKEIQNIKLLTVKPQNIQTSQKQLDGENQVIKIFSEEIEEKFRSALDTLHSFGIIHNDIKPNNLAWKDGQPLFFDFDISIIYISPTSDIDKHLRGKIHHYFSMYQQNLKESITSINRGKTPSKRKKIVNNLYDTDKLKIPFQNRNEIKDEYFFEILKIIDKISLEMSFYSKKNGRISHFDLHLILDDDKVKVLKKELDELYKKLPQQNSNPTVLTDVNNNLPFSLTLPKLLINQLSDSDNFSSDSDNFSSDSEND